MAWEKPMMKINAEDTKEYYNSTVDERHLRFLEDRGINISEYTDFLREGRYGILDYNTVTLCGEECMVNCFLGSSNEGIYDLIRDNEIFGIKPEEGTIFAILEGDDFLFFRPDDEAVYYCYRDTEEVFRVADSFGELLEMIVMDEE